MIVPSPIAGLILAGGQSRRMGTDKALIELDGVALVERARRRLATQAAPLLLSANGDPSRFEALGLPVLADCLPGHAGPLAGILTGLDHLAETTNVEWMVTVPTDSPLFPLDLVERLAGAGAPLAVAASGGRVHPVFALWRVELRGQLRRALVDEGERRMNALMQRLNAERVEWPVSPLDPFINVNTPEDLAGIRV